MLLANTDLLEPTFRRSVIYIVEHNDGGTLGVVLNRSSETAVYNVLPQWAKLAVKPKTMFIGGPVKRDAALCLAALRVGADPDGVPGLRHVAGRMVMVDLDADPDLIAPLVEGVRIFAGYSGWTVGQLEGEIERDDWIVLSALPSDVLVGPTGRPVGAGAASAAAAVVVACHPPDRRQPKLGLLPTSPASVGVEAPSVTLSRESAGDHGADDQLDLVKDHQRQHGQPDRGGGEKHQRHRKPRCQALFGAAEKQDDRVAAVKSGQPAVTVVQISTTANSSAATTASKTNRHASTLPQMPSTTPIENAV